MEQNLNLYQIFYYVAKYRSISNAAQKLFISQPAVSKAIRRLEDDLQTTLFIRSSRGVKLTETGELLYEQVHTAMSAFTLAEEKIREHTSKGSLQLSIGVSATLCKYVLLPLLKDFLTTFPNIKITISCQSTFETIRSVKNGSLDIGLVGMTEQADISCIPLMQIHDIFVCSNHYTTVSAIESNADPILSDASYILLDKENISRKYLDSYLASRQILLSHMIEVNNMDLAIEFAKQGLGIASVIHEFVEKDISAGLLHPILLKDPIPQREIGFVYLNNQLISEQMSDLISYYQTHKKEHPV